ncbi:PQQ-binding-like beta-propeller repeat protein [Sphingobacterium sp. HJSM2_6]|uniref:outer membrane protein assembly factor BamB family protein n=1 Tax=Sphingobacterium sp. HJSM2_6 TaxID=3366264 RepID=UPI003BE3FDC1
MKNIFPWIIMLCSFISCQNPDRFTVNDWAYAGGQESQQKYSNLTQINKETVSQLSLAWTYHSSDPSGNVQMNPVIVDGIVYITTPKQEVIAVEGETGKEKWRFNPARESEQFAGINRGIAFWRKKGERDRIFFTSAGYLNSIFAEDGKVDTSFGDFGRISLNEGQVKPADQMGITAPAAPVLYKDMVIVGAMTWSSPANVSAYHVKTGKRVWIFHTIPQPGEVGYETWANQDSWKDGAGVNVWGGLSVDSKNGMIYFSTGQPKNDFFRPDNEGDQLFGNCVVAIDGETGKHIWHYQAIRHDLWDLDLPCAPIVTELNMDGVQIPGLVQLTKTGNVLLFNRITGELLSKVEDREVPASSLEGEHASTTQPYVLWPEPFAKQVVTQEDLTRIDSTSHAFALNRFLSADAGWFIPPSLKGIIYYGIHGGAEWGGGSYDPNENMIYVNANELAWHITMQEINQPSAANQTALNHPGKALFLKNNCSNCHGANRQGVGGIPKLVDLNSKYSEQELVALIRNGKGAMPPFPQIGQEEMHTIASFLLDQEAKETKLPSAIEKPVYRAMDYTKFLDQNGYPATAAPWGTLNALDLTTGKVRWKVPLGEHPELTAKGIPQTGTENFGGSIVTAGGLVFVAATRDEKIRAFDKHTGQVLWEYQLPFGGYAVPSTYAVNGKQYLIIAATGGGKLGTKTGDAYIAFAIPE